MDEQQQVPTWRETGRFLTPAELGELSDEQRVQYLRESSAGDLTEIEKMPEPQRSTFLRLTERLAGREERAAS